MAQAPDNNQWHKLPVIKAPCGKEFELLTVLGLGSFGRTYLARCNSTKKLYAAKVITKKSVEMCGNISDVITEHRILKVIKHPFVVLENLLIDKQGHLRVVDFGLSKDNMHEGTHIYEKVEEDIESPETITNAGYGFSYDWWCLGLVIFELFTGHHAFGFPQNVNLNYNILHNEVELPDAMSSDTKTLIKGLLIKNPNNRLGAGPLGAKNVMKQLFFKEVRWEELEEQKLKPPFVPQLKSEIDTQMFEQCFTVKNLPPPSQNCVHYDDFEDWEDDNEKID